MKFPLAGYFPKPITVLAQDARAHNKGPVPFTPASFSYRKRCGVFRIEAMYVMIAVVGTMFLASAACMGYGYFKFKDVPKDPKEGPPKQEVVVQEEEEDEEELYG